MATVSLSVPIRGETWRITRVAENRAARASRAASSDRRGLKEFPDDVRKDAGRLGAREASSRAVGRPEPAPLAHRSKPHGTPDERPRDFPLTSSNPKSRRPGTAREASATRRSLEGVFAAYAPEPRR
jgi:hypothetical protein